MGGGREGRRPPPRTPCCTAASTPSRATSLANPMESSAALVASSVSSTWAAMESSSAICTPAAAGQLLAGPGKRRRQLVGEGGRGAARSPALAAAAKGHSRRGGPLGVAAGVPGATWGIMRLPTQPKTHNSNQEWSWLEQAMGMMPRSSTALPAGSTAETKTPGTKSNRGSTCTFLKSQQFQTVVQP